jgi:tRNA(Ile)-lysidine synthase
VARLSARVRRTLREHALAGPRDRIAVALSGGSDSVALLWILHDLSAAGDLDAELAGIFHLNHGLRGAEAARDEAFCRTLAERLSLPFETALVDVSELAREQRLSIEAAARTARYAFFEQAATRLGVTRVATGHTMDDQAETVLLRLLRGAGHRGMGGIRVRRGMFIRPLLECRRADLRAYLASKGEPFCEDSSNTDLAISRNRVRHRLLPVIEELTPRGVAAVARFAGLASSDEAAFAPLVNEAASAIVLSTDRGVQLNAGLLVSQPAAIGRRVVQRVLEQVGAGRGASAAHIEAVLKLAGRTRPRGRLDLQGVAVTRRAGTLVVEPAGGAEPSAAPFDLPLPLPGLVEIPGGRLSISADGRAGVGGMDGLGGGDTVVVQAAALTLPLRVRSRRPGDRLRPFGAPGRRKLQDVLVDRKVPRAERDRLPLVVDAAGRIVWVAGVTIAEECRVTAPEAGMVVLKARILT